MVAGAPTRRSFSRERFSGQLMTRLILRYFAIENASMLWLKRCVQEIEEAFSYHSPFGKIAG
jgi:hypothetical protein